ncbi:MAG: hypothetical protein KIS78_30120 [Labilithrix sp.]|nr:hypothetical protein [Labilithrix sp.]
MIEAPTNPLTGSREGSSDKEEVDPELLGLPDPPKRDRTMTVGLLVFTALASLAMVLALRRDAAYAFAEPHARDLGDLNTASPDAFVENQYVRGQAMLGAAGAIRYERPLVEGSFRLMPVTRAVPDGPAEDVWVEVRVPPRGENIRWVPPSEVSGRLVRFDTAGPRHRGLAGAVKDATGKEVPKGSWLLVDRSAPSDARWAVVLVGLFVGFAAWNAFATAKLLRKVKA